MRFIPILLILCGCASVPSVGNGGSVWDAQVMAVNITIAGQTLRIKGNCMSACTIGAEQIAQTRPDLVCVGKRAVFGFHQGQEPEGNGWRYTDVSGYYRQEVVDWVNENGGWPRGYPATYMRYDDLVKFYSAC